MKTIRERAADLVRLATAPSAEPGEAANAALAACRLIERHGLLGVGEPRAWRPDLVQSEQVVLTSAALCRACMERIDVGVPCHRIQGRGYQCQDCGPWSADAMA